MLDREGLVHQMAKVIAGERVLDPAEPDEEARRRADEALARVEIFLGVDVDQARDIVSRVLADVTSTPPAPRNGVLPPRPAKRGEGGGEGPPSRTGRDSPGECRFVNDVNPGARRFTMPAGLRSTTGPQRSM